MYYPMFVTKYECVFRKACDYILRGHQCRGAKLVFASQCLSLQQILHAESVYFKSSQFKLHQIT